MDPELIAYLDERFQGIAERFREQSQQIQGLREETSQQIQGLREETSQRFDKVDERLDQMDEQLRLTDVRVEGLQSQIQVVAEGVAAGNENLRAFRETVHLEFKDNRIQTSLFLKNMSERVRDLELRTKQPPL
jgi:hypothetical protein